MNYEVKIDEFEGPLDLLLHLIKESKVSIWDIKIEDITMQYLNYIRKMEELNLNVASSYLVMASELIEMKSRMLLPNLKEEEEEEDVDPREVLIKRLVEYQKYKEVTQDFKKLETLRQEIYTKTPESLKEYVDEKTNISQNYSLDDLLLALQKFMERKEGEKPLHTKVMEREITIEQRRQDIRSILYQKKRVCFEDLFENFTKEYVVVTFLAILEMARQKELCIHQEENFGPIVCEVSK